MNDLAHLLEDLLEKRGGVDLQGPLPWALKEYEFVDTLICQLESMKSGERRRVLMTLQYALSAADQRQESALDGFAVLNALLTSGFKLQRVNRVQLLRAVEEMGGKTTNTKTNSDANTNTNTSTNTDTNTNTNSNSN